MIQIDSTTATTVTSSTTTKTFSHTCSGSNRILWVVTGTHTSVASFSGVTYAGVAMTKSIELTNDGANGRIALWYLRTPQEGANNVVVTISATDLISAGAVSFTGVDQNKVPSITNSSTTYPSGVTSYTLSATATENDNLAVLGGYAMSGATLTGGTNTTILSQPETTYHGTFMSCSTNQVIPAGSISLIHTSTSQGFAGVMALMSAAQLTGKTNIFGKGRLGAY